MAAHLKSQFPRAQVVSGKEDAEAPSQRRKNHIAVFWPGYEVESRSTSLARPTLVIWFSPPFSKAPSGSAPRDPAPLEEAGDQLIAAFPRSTQAGGFFQPNVSCRLVRIVPNDSPDVWRVEATLEGYTLTAAA